MMVDSIFIRLDGSLYCNQHVASIARAVVFPVFDNSVDIFPSGRIRFEFDGEKNCRGCRVYREVQR